MNYENLNDQGKDAQNALKFLPKSMVKAVTKARNPKSDRKEDWYVKLAKSHVSDAKILPRDIDFGQADSKAEAAPPIVAQPTEEKQAFVATGVGTLAVVILVYLLFIR